MRIVWIENAASPDIFIMLDFEFPGQSIRCWLN